MNIYTYCPQDGQIYSNMKVLVTKFMKIYNMPDVHQQSFLLRKIFTVGIPKPTFLVIIFKVFIFLLSFKNMGKKNYPYAEFCNVSSRKRTRSSHKESDKNGTSSSSSDNETTPKFKKRFGTNYNAKFDARMKKRCEFIIKADNDLFQKRTRKPMLVLTSFQNFLNSDLDRLSLQRLECEMDSSGYPEKYNFF